jgi:membrane protein DedA with SNARE-associated domain
MAAGCGVPVSEDGLCLFCGAIWATSPNKLSLLTALYLGVVGSDAVTFWIGRALRLGLFQPIRDRLQLHQQEGSDVHGGDSKRQHRLKGILSSSGDWIGFVVRFCVGARGPLMLLSGFTNQVSFVKFIIGSAVGACLSLPLQLYGGYVLGRDDPAAVVGVVGILSTFVAAAALCGGVASWGALLVTQLQRRRRKENASVT